MNERVNYMKKTWKRLGALFLAVAMTLTLLPTAAFAEGEMTEPENAVPYANMTLSAPSYNNDSTEGAPALANDANTTTLWHTNYSGSSGTGTEDVSANNGEERYIQIALTEATWLTSLRYLSGTGGNGWVIDYEIRTTADDTVTDNTVWAVASAGTGWAKQTWQQADFDQPVKAKYIRLYGLYTGGAAGSGDGKGKFMNAAEIRLIQTTETPETRTVSGKVVDINNNGLEGVTVAIGGRGVVTGPNGTFSISDLPQGYKYAVTVTKTGYAQYDGSVEEGTNNVELDNITLSVPSATISGTITDDKSAGLPGAKVGLVQDATGYPIVTNFTPVTVGNNEGTYELNVSSLSDGKYKIRVTMDGHGAQIGYGSITVSEGKAVTSVIHNDVVLPAIETDEHQARYKWTFDGDDKPADKALVLQDGAAVAYTDGAMKVTWANGDRSQNLVSINNTNARNCTIEFDATRGTEDITSNGNKIRFGIVLRSRLADDGSRYWIYVGQESAAAGNKWGVQPFKTTATGGLVEDGWKYVTNGPAFNAGETRHFKVTIEDTRITMEVDGMQVVNLDITSGLEGHNQSNITNTNLDIAGDVGLIWGNSDMKTVGSHSITIDNLYVFRNDPAFKITAEKGTETNSADLTVTYTDNGVTETDLNQVPAGVPVKVVADNPENGKGLGEVTVQKTGDATTTVTATPHGDDNGNVYYTFTMPAYAVTVSGELKDTFKAKLPFVAEGEGENLREIETAPKQGTAYIVELTPAEATATYQWYIDEGNEDQENFVRITDATDKSYTPDENDVGKKLRVVVTGTGSYTGIQTLTTENPVAEADTEVSSISLSEDTVELWTNDDNAKTATLTVTVNPNNATDPTIRWASSDEDVVAFEQDQENPRQITLTAKANGTARITVTVTSANGTAEFTKTCEVTVGIKPTGVTVYNGTTEVNATDKPLVLYSNSNPVTTGYDDDGNPIIETLPTSATLAFTVEPEGATTNNKITNDREKGNYDLISRGELGTSGYTFSVVNPGPDNVGEETFHIYYGALDDENKVPMGDFRIVVLRWLDTTPEIVIKGGGQPRPGATLAVNPDSLDAPADKVYIYWCYQEGDDVGYLEVEGEGDDAKVMSNPEYTLKPNDIGKGIFAFVMAVEDYGTETSEEDRCYYTGDVSSYAITVLPGAAPAAPKLTVTHVDGDTKGTITITNYDENETYQIKKTAEAWVGVEDNTQDAKVKSQTVDGKTVGVIEGLEAGTYQVRVKENDLHEAGEAAPATIRDNTISKTYYDVTVTETPAEGGTAVLSADSVEEGATVTLTVNPAVGYEIKSVKVAGSDEALVGDPQTDGMVYTATVTADTEFVVIYEKITLTITHDLDGLKCDLSETPEDKHTVKYGEVSEITLSLTDEAREQGLVLPDRDGVKIFTVKGDVETPFTNFDYANGKITFRNGVTQDMKITARAKLVSYSVSFDLTHLETTDGGPTAFPTKDYTATLSVPEADRDMWARPQTITIRRGTGTILTAGTDYTYDPTTGEVTIKKEAITGNLAIIAVGVLKPTEVQSVTITIGHQDADVVSDVPHVGDILSADVLPTGASVTYAWYVSGNDEPVSTTKNYTVDAADLGKTIKVVVTGRGIFSGEKESTPTKAVGNTVKLPTRVTLNQYNHSMSVGQSFTLIPTVLPGEATDKTVTWSVLEATSDTEVTGVVTLTKNANGSVAVRANSAGTVRIVATTVNGRTASCTLIIERANSYTINYQIVGGAANVTMLAGGELVGNGGSVAATTPVTIQVTPDDPTHNVAIIVTTDSASVNATKTANKNEWTFDMPAENTGISINVGAEVKPVTGVSVTPTTATVAVNETVNLTAVIEPEDADNKNVTWSSSDETIATVGETGVVTGVKAGTATITVEADGGNFTATCAITVTGTVVTNVPVTGVTLDETSLSLTVGATHTLHATVAPSEATNQSISWESDDTSVATVSGGVVTAEGVGTATITVTTEDGSKTATCAVTVTAGGTITVPVGGITVTAPGSTTIQLPEGQTRTVQLTANITPDSATNKAVTWTTSDAAVATVDANGLVTIRSTGSVTITATSDEDNTISGSCLLTIEAAPVAVTGVSLPESDTVRVGQTITLIPVITPSNAVNKGVTWESRYNTIASVAADADGNGVVTALAVGTTTIIVTTLDGGYQATCTVNVVAANAEIPVESVTVSYDGGAISLPASGTTQVTLTAEVLPSGATNKAVTWSSDNPSIATVDNGVVTITGTGTVTITATSVADTTKSGSCTLTITTVHVAGVSLDKGTLDLTVGESDTLIPTVAPAEASNKSVTWESSDPAVAEVDANGKVTAKAAGTATITVKTVDGEFIATCAVTVTQVVVPPAGPIGGGIVTPPSTTTVVENPDGSTTTTVTDNRTGTVTETTEMPDGSTETVETKKDGTVTTTTEKPDGTTEAVEKKPDGTVTATTIDPEGGKVEKITTPDEDVTITVTDPEGETLVKVELPAEIPASPIQFVDVPEGHWAESAINQAAGLGLVQGVGDDQFNLNGDMKRGDLALVLYNLSNGNEGYDVTFDDVPADMYYADGVAWAARTGVVNGFSETEFGPESTITREQLAAMLYRYADLLKLDTTISGDGLDAFADGGSISGWAEDGMAWCVENGIIKGQGNGVLAPGTNATRAEVTVMLQRFMDLMK